MSTGPLALALALALAQYTHPLTALASADDRDLTAAPTLSAVEAVLATRVRFTEALIDAGRLPPRAALVDMERDRAVLQLDLGLAALSLEHDAVDLRTAFEQRPEPADAQ